MSNTKPNGGSLSAEAVAAYHRDGYIFPLDAVTTDHALDVATRFAQVDPREIGSLKHPWHIKAHLLFRWIYDLTVQPAVLDAVQSIIGPNILMQAADLFVKPPHHTKIINWHQDANYWGFDPYTLVTAWIALSDVFPENGCMRYLPGSHVKSKLRHVETYGADSDLTRGQEIDLKIDEDKAVPVILKAGQMSLHHCLLAHASGPNQTDSPRLGLAIRFLPTHVKQTQGPPMSAILVRGEDHFHHFVEDTPPTGNLDSAAIAAHDRSMAVHAASGYATA